METRSADLDIVKVFIEKQSAKSPGHAEFNKLLTVYGEARRTV